MYVGIHSSYCGTASLSNSSLPIICRTAYANVAGKYQDVLTLEQSVAELHQMFLDFALLTEQQGELLDQIEYQVKSAADYVEDANVDVHEAIEYQKKIRKKQWSVRGCFVSYMCSFRSFSLLLSSASVLYRYSSPWLFLTITNVCMHPSLITANLKQLDHPHRYRLAHHCPICNGNPTISQVTVFLDTFYISRVCAVL